jgi:hypothetical protein
MSVTVEMKVSRDGDFVIMEAGSKRLTFPPLKDALTLEAIRETIERAFAGAVWTETIEGWARAVHKFAQTSDPMVATKEPVEPIMQYFEFDHLPPHLAAVSGDFYALACTLVATLPRNPERTVALRKLLEAKDAAVRAKVAR